MKAFIPRHLASKLFVPAALALLATAACSSSDPAVNTGDGDGDGDTTAGVGGTTPSGSGGATASGGASAAGGGFLGTGGATKIDCSTPAPGATPSFAVTEHFIASGYMGDGEVADGIALIENGCGSDRAPGAIGECFAFEYTPNGHAGWAGVVWQYPMSNWGDAPGLCVGAGATEVSFWARTDEDAEVTASFSAASTDSASTGDVTITDEWTEFTIDLSGVDYNAATTQGGVIWGFSWVMGQGEEPITDKMIYVDSIQWVGSDGGLGGAPN